MLHGHSVSTALPDLANATIPPVFCWTKMGAEAGQGLADILRRKDLERACGNGVFAWGIGNSIGPAIEHARSAAQIQRLEALFSPMKSAPKTIDAAPSKILVWTGYYTREGTTAELPRHMLITSRGSESTDGKKNHYALICRSRLDTS